MIKFFFISIDPSPCQEQSNPVDGTVSSHTDAQDHGTELTYTCSDGYEPTEEKQTCNSGLWVPLRVFCQGKLTFLHHKNWLLLTSY